MTTDQPYSGRVEDGAHLLPIRVYYEDTDASGIVYHANYLRYFERGRTDFVRLAGVSHTELKAREEPLVFVVRKVAIEYLRSAKVDDSLVVRSSLSRVEGPKMVVRQQVERSGEVLARGEVELVFVRGDGRPARSPRDVAERLQAAFKPTSQIETPAAKAIRLLGAKPISAACDLTTNAVWKWETQGHGRIPARHQGAVLKLARRRNAPLTAADVVAGTVEGAPHDVTP